MIRATEVLDSIMKNVLAGLMAIMVIVVSWQVATRYLLNSPSSYTEELASYLLIWISLLGASYALRLKAHLGIDVLTRKLAGGSKRTMEIVALLAVIFFSLLILVVGGLRLVQVTFYLNQLSAAFQVPVAYVYLVLPLSGVLMIYYSIYLILYPENA